MDDANALRVRFELEHGRVIKFVVGTIYGIELLNANEQLWREEPGRLLFVNEATGQRAEVPLATG